MGKSIPRASCSKAVTRQAFVQQGGDEASLVTAYAALRPRDGFSHPHQEHMKDTYTPDPGFAVQYSTEFKLTKAALLSGKHQL